VPDRSLDFVYIDGNHGYEAVLDDLAAWSPKVRTGGFISGHDYRVNAAKPFIEVVEAVNDWTRMHAIEPWFTLARDKTPSFFWEVH
jgi:cephalosporin hydroxylase